MRATRGTGPRPTRAEPPVAIDRRRFLVTIGGAAAYVALRPSLAIARKLAESRPPQQPWSLPARPPTDPDALARALISAAVLAPSHWNTQPWRMEVFGSSIRLVADPRRALPVTDPNRAAMMMSLGAALENMLIAMRAYGLRPTVRYFPDGDAGPVAEATWGPGDGARDRDLFAAIPERRTNRRNYDGRGIIMQNRAALTALVTGDLKLHWMDDRDRIHDLSNLVFQATREQVMDPRAQAEHVAWTRFSDEEARRSADGVTVDALELGGPARWFARRYFRPGGRFIGLGAGSAAKQEREAIRTAGAVVLLSSARGGATQALMVGQAYERLALKATRLGIANQPIQSAIEVARHRSELLRHFGAGGEQPFLMVRLGHARRPEPSMRRSVALVATFRNS